MPGDAALVPCSPAQKRWVLAASILGSSLAFIDGTVVNVALPAIQRGLDASVYQAQWVVESYALLLASLLLVGGSMGDRFGRRRIFIIGVAIFGVASVACALSQSAGQLIAARAVQGVGGALLVPGSLALITMAFPENERGAAIGTWAGFSGVTTSMGPLLGGYLIDHLSWHWAFALNVPLVLLVIAIAFVGVPPHRPDRTEGSLDWPGAMFATLGLGGLVFAFIEAPVHTWRSIEVLAALALGIASLAGFVWAEARHESPMLPMRMLRNREFAGANLLTLLLYGALGGGLFFMPLNLIQVQGLSATAAGASLLPFVVIMFVLSRWTGGLVARHGSRLPLIIGPSIAAVGFALLTVPGASAGYFKGFFPGIAVLGLGMAIAIAPLTTTVMNAVDAESAGTASGVNNAVSRVAGLLAIAVFGWLMASVFEPRLQDRLRAGGIPPETANAVWQQRDKLAAIAVPSAPGEDAAREGVRDAFVSGYRLIMALSAAMALTSAGIAAVFLRGSRER